MTLEEVTELYEQAKRILRGSLPADVTSKGFVLACHDCGLAYPNEAEVGMVGQHAELAHGWVQGESKLKLDLVFVGEGPPPKGSS